MSPRRLLTVAALAATVVPAASADAAPRPRDRAKLARSLATAVAAAKTEPARTAAIERIWKAFDLPVYDNRRATYKQLVRDGRDNAFGRAHLVLIARAQATGTPLPLERLAGGLAAAGVRARGGAPVSAATLAASLRTTIAKARRAKSRRKASALLPLLLAELASRGPRPSDLAAGRPDTALDAVGTQLLFVAAERLARPPVRRRAHALLASVAQAGCPAKYASKGAVGDALEGAIAALDGLLFDKARPNKLLEYAREELLRPAATFRVAGDATTPDTDYGPAGHPALSPIAGRQIRIVVEAKIDYPADVKTDACGSLWSAGITLPPNGPLKDTAIDFPPLAPDLLVHGAVTRRDTRTDAAGRATLEFRPNDELVPGEGDYAQKSSEIVAFIDLADIDGAGGRPDPLRTSTTVIVGFREQLEVAATWNADLRGGGRFIFSQRCNGQNPEVWKDDRSTFAVGSAGAGTFHVVKRDGKGVVRSQFPPQLPYAQPGDIILPGSTAGAGIIEWSRLTPGQGGCTQSSGTVNCSPRGRSDLLHLHMNNDYVVGAALQIDMSCPLTATGDVAFWGTLNCDGNGGSASGDLDIPAVNDDLSDNSLAKLAEGAGLEVHFDAAPSPATKTCPSPTNPSTSYTVTNNPVRGTIKLKGQVAQRVPRE